MKMQQYSMNQNTYSMQPGMMDPAMHQQQMHDFCKQHRHHLVQFETTDGQVYDGIIDSVNQDGVNMLVPDGDTERSGNDEFERQFGFGGFHGHGFPRRFRRFRPFFFPFFGIRRFFFPFFI